MELKFFYQWVNPNESFSFNRTFMELKWLCSKHMTMGQVSFNRTFMELKLLNTT